MKTIYITLLALLLSMSNLHGQKEKSPDSFIKKGNEYLKKENYKEALNMYRKSYSLALSSEALTHAYAGISCYGIGYSMFFNGEADSVAIYFDKALRYFEKANDVDNLARFLSLISEIHRQIKKWNYPVLVPPREKGRTAYRYIRVLEIKEDYGDSALVVLDGGSYEGIIPHSSGNLIGLYTSDEPARSDGWIGGIRVTEVSVNRTYAIVYHYHPGVENMRCRIGDLASLPVVMPVINEQSIFSSLFDYDISLLSMDRDYIIHPRILCTFDSPILEKAVFKKYTEDLKATYETVKDMVTDYPEWGRPMEKGQFKGKSMLEALEKPVDNEMRSFLYYVKEYYSSYAGKDFKFNETYATWVLNYGPVCNTEMIQKFMQTSSDEEVLTLYYQYEDNFANGSLMNDIQATIESYSDNGEISKAYQLQSIHYKISTLRNDTSAIGFSWFSMGVILNDEKKYEESNKAYKTALSFFRKTNNLMGISFCLTNIAVNLNEDGRYDESIHYIDSSIYTKMERIATDSNYYSYKSLGISYWSKGYNLYSMSRFVESIEAYKKAIEIYGRLNTPEGQKGVFTLNKNIGSSYKKMGDNPNARIYYEKAYKRAIDLADIQSQGDMLDEIAFITDDTRKANELYEKAYQLKLSVGNKAGAGFSKSNVGQTYWTLEEYQKAIDAHNVAVSLRQDAGDYSGQAYSLSKLAGLYKESGDPNKAIDLFNQALNIYKELDDKPNVALILKDLGATYNTVKDYKNALTYYEESVKIYNTLPSRQDYATSIYDLGTMYYNERNYEKARELFDQALAIQQNINDKDGLIYTYTYLGLVSQYVSYKSTDAEEFYNKAFKLAEETGNRYNIAYSIMQVGRLYYQRGDIDKAEKKYLDALSIYKELGENQQVSSTMIDLGYLYFNKANLELARDYFLKTYALADSSKDRINMANANSALSNMARMKGDFNNALEYENNSLALSLEVDNQWGIAASYLNLGNINNYMGDYKKALRYYEMTDSIYQLIGSEISLTDPLNNTGTIYFWQGNYDKSLPYFFKAHEILTRSKLDPRFLSIVKTNIGEVYYDKGKYDSAAVFLREALELSRSNKDSRGTAYALLILAKLNNELKNNQQALTYLDEGKKIFDQWDEKMMLIDWYMLYGKCLYAMNRVDEAEKYLEKSILMCRDINAIKREWEPLFYLSEIYKK